MDSQTLVQASGYIALGIAAWPICKYVLGPVFAGTHATDVMKDIVKQSFDSYRANSAEIIRQRANVATELGKAGRNAKEISDILDSTLPLPDAPSIE